ncbi:MAG TPA: hypothetical protein VM238_20640 [Phycisphaerae bacterium]|nr:hypothetical protein [Phycisphaerae bacterium]
MGPTIILDKSALQCLSRDDTFELSRYFYTVVPPVLILEILADLKKPKLNTENAQAAVRSLAEKIPPVDSYVNMDYRTLCTADLLGGRLEMGRRPVIGGGERVVAENGTVGVFRDVQPQNEALTRWSCGEFAEAEELLAEKWRAASQAIDLESTRKALRGHLEWVPLKSLADVREVVDQLMSVRAAQASLLNALLQELRMIPEVAERTNSRWRNGGCQLLREFADYGRHCASVSLMFQLALMHGLIGTRSTNRIDMEYLYYTPFASLFCSGDKLHRAMAEIVLEGDQSFVWHDDLRLALRQVAEARHRAGKPGSEDWCRVQPKEDSLIWRLWKKHLGHGPETFETEPRSQAQNEETMASIKPLMDACEKLKRKLPPRPRWPCP